MVTITRKSPFTGMVNSLEIDMPEDEFQERLESWQRGVYIQDAFPMLTAGEREFIKTGITPEDWQSQFDDDPSPYDGTYSEE